MHKSITIILKRKLIKPKLPYSQRTWFSNKMRQSTWSQLRTISKPGSRQI